jgi:hypothetical protein
MVLRINLHFGINLVQIGAKNLATTIGATAKVARIDLYSKWQVINVLMAACAHQGCSAMQ